MPPDNDGWQSIWTIFASAPLKFEDIIASWIYYNKIDYNENTSMPVWFTPLVEAQTLSRPACMCIHALCDRKSLQGSISVIEDEPIQVSIFSRLGKHV